jgi:hypothetical protein
MRGIRFILFFSIFIATSTTICLSARPFVTEEAFTADSFQLDVALWIKAENPGETMTLGQNLFLGIGITDWLQISGASGRGYDFDTNEQTFTNPSFQVKALLLSEREAFLPGLALISGVNFRSGKGEAWYDDASSYYTLLALHRSFFQEHLNLHVNLGRRFVNERYKNTYDHIYWGVKLDTVLVPQHLIFSAEAFRGDLFRAIVPHITYQTGLSWLLTDKVHLDFLLGAQREVDREGIKTRRYDTWGICGVRVLFDMIQR